MNAPIELTPAQARAILAAVPAEDVALAVEALRRPHRWHGLRPHGQSTLRRFWARGHEWLTGEEQ